MSTKIRPLQKQVLRQLYEVCEFINEGMIIVGIKGNDHQEEIMKSKHNVTNLLPQNCVHSVIRYIPVLYETYNILSSIDYSSILDCSVVAFLHHTVFVG